MPRTPYLLLALAILLSVARLSPRVGAEPARATSGVRACVIALSKALSTRLIADDYPVDLQDDRRPRDRAGASDHCA